MVRRSIRVSLSCASLFTKIKKCINNYLLYHYTNFKIISLLLLGELVVLEMHQHDLEEIDEFQMQKVHVLDQLNLHHVRIYLLHCRYHQQYLTEKMICLISLMKV